MMAKRMIIKIKSRCVIEKMVTLGQKSQFTIYSLPLFGWQFKVTNLGVSPLPMQLGYLTHGMFLKLLNSDPKVVLGSMLQKSG